MNVTLNAWHNAFTTYIWLVLRSTGFHASYIDTICYNFCTFQYRAVESVTKRSSRSHAFDTQILRDDNSRLFSNRDSRVIGVGTNIPGCDTAVWRKGHTYVFNLTETKQDNYPQFSGFAHHKHSTSRQRHPLGCVASLHKSQSNYDEISDWK